MAEIWVETRAWRRIDILFTIPSSRREASRGARAMQLRPEFLVSFVPSRATPAPRRAKASGQRLPRQGLNGMASV
jgi:hypothetical protein